MKDFCYPLRVLTPCKETPFMTSHCITSISKDIPMNRVTSLSFPVHLTAMTKTAAMRRQFFSGYVRMGIPIALSCPSGRIHSRQRITRIPVLRRDFLMLRPMLLHPSSSSHLRGWPAPGPFFHASSCHPLFLPSHLILLSGRDRHTRPCLLLSFLRFASVSSAEV